MTKTPNPEKSQIILYTSQDGQVKWKTYDEKLQLMAGEISFFHISLLKKEMNA